MNVNEVKMQASSFCEHYGNIIRFGRKRKKENKYQSSEIEKLQLLPHIIECIVLTLKYKVILMRNENLFRRLNFRQPKVF